MVAYMTKKFSQSEKLFLFSHKSQKMWQLLMIVILSFEKLLTKKG